MTHMENFDMHPSVAKAFVDKFTLVKDHVGMQGRGCLKSRYMRIPEKHLSILFVSDMMNRIAGAMDRMGLDGKYVFEESRRENTITCGLYFLPKTHVVTNNVLKDNNSFFYIIAKAHFNSIVAEESYVDFFQVKTPEFFRFNDKRNNTTDMMPSVAIHLVNGLVKNNMDPIEELHAIAKYGERPNPDGSGKKRVRKKKAKAIKPEPDSLLSYLRKTA